MAEDLRARVEHLVDRRSVRVGAWLYRRTGGRVTRLWHRRALVLTTTGRRTGLPRTVLVQAFPDHGDLVVVAANSGLPTHPAWYLNLRAHPEAVVEFEGRTLQVRAERLTAAEVQSFWPRVLAAAPDYARYPQRTDRAIPLMRLVVRAVLPPGAPALVRRSPQTGIWPPGMPCLRWGAGLPVVLLPGLTTHHELPRGLDRAAATGTIRGLGRRREVWWLNRRAGLPPGATMADLAADCARGIREHLPYPVDVVGISTGGSIALQLAADHPELVRRLVLVSAACRLGPGGRAGQRELAAALRAGDTARAGAAMFSTLGTPRSTAAWRTAGRLLGRWMFPHDPADLLAVIDAEDAFDLTDRLERIMLPVLVVGGDQDQPYGPDLLTWTADKLPLGRLLLYRGTSHSAVHGRRRLADDVLTFLDPARLPPGERPRHPLEQERR